MFFRGCAVVPAPQYEAHARSKSARSYPFLLLLAAVRCTGQIDFDLIKLGYYGGMRNLNPSGIIPLGPALDFSAPHDRGRLAKAA